MIGRHNADIGHAISPGGEAITMQKMKNDFTQFTDTYTKYILGLNESTRYTNSCKII